MFLFLLNKIVYKISLTFIQALTFYRTTQSCFKSHLDIWIKLNKYFVSTTEFSGMKIQDIIFYNIDIKDKYIRTPYNSDILFNYSKARQ